MPEVAFQWLRRPGFAVAAVYPPGLRVPRPLEAQAADAATLVWLPLAHAAPARRVLGALPPPALLLFPPRPEDAARVVDTWLRLYAEAPAALHEAVLQVVDDPAALRDYLAAEDALWGAIYEAHPHKESAGLYPRALEEARWLTEAVLGHREYGERSEFLTLAALETVARELLLTVRRAEMTHLRDHLRGVEPYLGW